METRAYSVLRKNFERIKHSNADPGGLADELFAAGIIGEEDVKAARNIAISKPDRRGELLDSVTGNGEEGVFQTFVGILLSKRHLKWLGAAIKGKSYVKAIYDCIDISTHFCLNVYHSKFKANVSTIFFLLPKIAYYRRVHKARRSLEERGLGKE